MPVPEVRWPALVAGEAFTFDMRRVDDVFELGVLIFAGRHYIRYVAKLPRVMLRIVDMILMIHERDVKMLGKIELVASAFECCQIRPSHRETFGRGQDRFCFGRGSSQIRSISSLDTKILTLS